jgi:hypothetical protein
LPKHTCCNLVFKVTMYGARLSRRSPPHRLKHATRWLRESK